MWQTVHVNAIILGDGLNNKWLQLQNDYLKHGYMQYIEITGHTVVYHSSVW